MAAFIFIICFMVPFYLMLWISANAKEEELPGNVIIPPVSLIIPFRNEEKYLPGLVECLRNLILEVGDEVILVNDQSEYLELKHFENLPHSVRLIHIKKGIISSKKHALTLAIRDAANDWILTTDADCIYSKNWLKSKKKGIRSHNCDMIVSPLSSIPLENGFFSLVSNVELLVLQTITRAAVINKSGFLANGANLMFRKSVWEKVGAYTSHEHLASGDDVLLLSSFKSHGYSVVYDHGAENTVLTYLNNDMQDWFNQRIRWISKRQNIHSWKEILISSLFLIWMFNFIPGLLQFGLLYTLVIIPELLLLKLYSPIHVNFKSAAFWPIFRLVYPFLVIVIVILSITKKNPTWKGRPLRTSH
ncbi:MAG: glycosyltransferase [Bacteroidia bacterium]